MNDCKAETRAAGFVEPTTTLTNQPLAAFGKPGAVVFDDKTERGMLLDRRHTHKRNSITRSVFEEISDYLHKIDAIHSDHKRRIDMGFESGLDPGSRQRPHERVDDLPNRRFSRLASTTNAFHPRPREFARDMSLHSITNALD